MIWDRVFVISCGCVWLLWFFCDVGSGFSDPLRMFVFLGRIVEIPYGFFRFLVDVGDFEYCSVRFLVDSCDF